MVLEMSTGASIGSKIDYMECSTLCSCKTSDGGPPFYCILMHLGSIYIPIPSHFVSGIHEDNNGHLTNT